MSVRIDKINQLLKKEIANILQKDLNDRRLVFVSITHVETTKDLRQCKVYFSILEGDKEEILNILNKAKGYIRYLMGKRIKIKVLPQIRFYIDDSIERGFKIDQIFEKLHEKDKKDNIGE